MKGGDSLDNNCGGSGVPGCDPGTGITCTGHSEECTNNSDGPDCARHTHEDSNCMGCVG